MAVSRIEYDKIKPEMGEKNWKVVSQDKVEFIHGEMYTTISKTNWFYPIIKVNKQNTVLGFYSNSEKPKEVVRVAGMAPDLWVITFRKV